MDQPFLCVRVSFLVMVIGDYEEKNMKHQDYDIQYVYEFVYDSYMNMSGIWLLS